VGSGVITNTVEGKKIMSKKLLCKESKNQHTVFLPKAYKRIAVSQVCERIQSFQM